MRFASKPCQKLSPQILNARLGYWQVWPQHVCPGAAQDQFIEYSSNSHIPDLTELNSPPGDAISSVQYCPDVPTRLLVSSWDRHVYLYDTHAEPGGRLLERYEHRAPVLGVCFGENQDEAYSVGLDWDVRR